MSRQSDDLQPPPGMGGGILELKRSDMFMSENTNKSLPTKEEVLQNEDSLLRGLLEAGSYKDDEEFRRKIEIKRGGKALFSFTVRPLSEEEEIACYKRATPKIPNPAGRHLPRIDGKTDSTAMRSWKIYTATIEEDQQKVWNNPEYKKRKGFINPLEVIDSLLRSGDKDAVLAVIDEISGSRGTNDAVDDGEDDQEPPTLEEYAKN